MKKMISTFSMPLIILSFLITGAVDAGTIGATIKVRPTLAESANDETISEIDIVEDNGGVYAEVKPEIVEDSGGVYAEIKPEIVEDNGGVYAEVKPEIVEDSGGVYAEIKPEIVEDNDGVYAKAYYDCGGPEHQNLPLGDRFVLVRDGKRYFLDRKTCIEWYTRGWQKNQDVIEQGYEWGGFSVSLQAASWACIQMRPNDSHFEWHLPTIDDLESLTVPGKQNPAVPNDFPDGMLRGPYGCDFNRPRPDGTWENINDRCSVWSGSSMSDDYPEIFWKMVMNMSQGTMDFRYSKYCECSDTLELRQVWCVNKGSYRYLNY